MVEGTTWFVFPQINKYAWHYRPVALTSNIMKTLERLVLDQLRSMVRPHLDPLKSAYQPRIGVEDAIIYLLNYVHAHLDKLGSTVRVTFSDSSAFNTRPALLDVKLMSIIYFLIHSYFTRYVRFYNLNNCSLFHFVYFLLTISSSVKFY